MNQHSLRVALRGRNFLERQAGLCHDMVEDGFCTLEEVRNIFGTQVAEVVDILTHKADESYDEYIDRVCNSGSEAAVRVKLSDNADNWERCAGLHGGSIGTTAQIQKYSQARKALRGVLFGLGVAR